MTLRSNSRKQFDYSRPLLKENSLEAFLRLDGSDAAETSFPEGGKVGNLRRKDTVIPEASKKPETAAAGADAQKGKPNIAIPSVNKLDDENKEVATLKKFQTEENYLRYTYVKLYPQPEVYEASDYDLEFLKELNLNSSGKLKTGSEQITREDFERMIEIWDAETDKDEPISLQKAQASIEKVFDISAFKDQISEIYIYWKGRREAFKRPLVRKYWRTVNKDEMNPNIVFRAREKQKIETRRHKKGNTVENLEKMKGLKNELEMARTLLANITLREMIKAELNGLSISKFDITAQERIEGGSSGITLINYKEKFENEERLHKRSQLKEFNKIAKQFIDQPKEEPENGLLSKIPQALGNLVIKNINRAEENNFLIARFISNVAMRTDQKNITFEKVDKLDLPSVQQIQQMPTPIIQPLPVPIDTTKRDQVSREKPDLKGTDFVKPPHVKPAEDLQANLPGVLPPKNIFRYKIRRRFGRQGRQYIDKIYVPPEDAQFEIFKDRAYEIIPPRKLVKLDTFERGPLNALYEKKYSKIDDLYPFADSDDDKDLAEFSKSLKKTLSSFKNFQKQRRSSTIAAE